MNQAPRTPAPEPTNRWKSIAWIIGPPLAILIAAFLIIRPSFGTATDASQTAVPSRAVDGLPTAFPSIAVEPVTVASVQITTVPFAPGASVYDFALAGERVIAGGADRNEAGIWYSDDRGETWSRASLQNLDPPDTRAHVQIEALAVHQGRLAALGRWYFGASGNPITQSIWISDDAGASWTEIPVDIPKQVVLSMLAGGDRGFFAAGFGAGISLYRSDDAVTWEPLEQDRSFQNAQIFAMVAHGDGLLLTGMYTGRPTEAFNAEPYVWRFTDEDGWQSKAIGKSRPGIAGDVVQDSSGIYVGGFVLSGNEFDESIAAVWRSKDGVDWTSIPVSDSIGLRAGTLAHGPLGTIVTGTATDAFEGRRDPDRPTFLWFTPNGDRTTAQEYHVAWYPAAAIGLSDRFLFFAGCGARAEGCDPPQLVTISGSDDSYHPRRRR